MVTVSGGVLIFAIADRYLHDQHKFPKPVAAELRRAIRLHKFDNESNIPSAIKHYRLALEEAAKQNMDTTSDEVTGIQIQLAGAYEEIDRPEKAVSIYSGILRGLKLQMASLADKNEREDLLRLTRRAIAVSIKLGNSFLDAGKSKEAESHLVWAVEQLARDLQRQSQLSPTTQQANNTLGGSMTPEEIGATFEALGTFYQQQKKPRLVVPLYLKALEMMNPPTCHSSVLSSRMAILISLTYDVVSNIAAAMADEFQLQNAKGSEAPQLLNDAMKWAKRAISQASVIPADKYTEECESSCLSATVLFTIIAALLISGSSTWG